MKKTIIFTLLILIPSMEAQQNQTIVAVRKRAVNPCGTGQPTWSAQYIATTLTPGNVSAWTDSSGNGHNMSGFSDGSANAIAGVTDATPNGSQTIVWSTATIQAGVAAGSVNVASGLTICGVWKSPIPPSAAASVVLGNGGLSGGPSNYGFGAGMSLDKSGITNVGNTSGTPISANTWVSTCWTYVPGTGAWKVYINGTLNNSGTNVQTFAQNLNILQGGFTISASPKATIAEVDWSSSAITAGDVTNVHNCMVSRFGVP